MDNMEENMEENMEDNMEDAIAIDKSFDAELTSRHYICPECQKLFVLPLYVLPNTYAYSVNVKDKKTKKCKKERCCSYTCFRKYTSKLESRR